MLDNKIKLWANHEKTMGNNALTIFQQAVNEYRELFTEAQLQITPDMYAMREAILRFDTRLGNISYSASG
jgi:hypothetical protein